MYNITTKYGTYARYAWTGGDTPRNATLTPQFIALRSVFFREYVSECGGLDLWKCAGTSCMQRARIFWNWANLDAWSTLRETKRGGH